MEHLLTILNEGLINLGIKEAEPVTINHWIAKNAQALLVFFALLIIIIPTFLIRYFAVETQKSISHPTPRRSKRLANKNKARKLL